MSERIIFHVDVNSAFVSWSSIQLLNNGAKIDYRTVPSVAAKNINVRGSIVTSKSIPAKQYGIITGEPTLFAVRKCPNLVILPLDFDWYRTCSSNMMGICRKYSSIVQPFSIDECFIDMSDFPYDGRHMVEIAYNLKDEIRDTLGFTVNVGVGPNKLLAKMASDMSGPDQVHRLCDDNFKMFLWGLDVQKLFFCGPKSADRLRSNGIMTIGDLACTPLEYVQQIIGQKFGAVLWQYANGIDESPVVTDVRKRKSLSHAHTLEHDAMTYNEVLIALQDVVREASKRLDAEGVKARLFSVSLRSNAFEIVSKQHKEDVAVNGYDDIYRCCVELTKQIYIVGVPIRQVGVGIGCFEEIDELSEGEE